MRELPSVPIQTGRKFMSAPEPETFIPRFVSEVVEMVRAGPVAVPLPPAWTVVVALPPDPQGSVEVVTRPKLVT